MSRLHLAKKATWPTVANRKSPLRDRFCVKVGQGENGCWEWAGAHAPNGYAQIGNQMKVLYAHRVSYELFVGPIPDGMHIDHLCNNPGCVRPTHLEPVTQAENNRRAGERRLTCRRGHLWTSESTYIRPDGTRLCRICSRDRRAR